MVGVALLLPVISLVSLGGATERYEVDFISLLIIAAAVGWLWLAERLRGSPWTRRAVLGVGTAAVAYSAAANLAFGVVGYYDGLRLARPATYERLEDAFGWVPTLAARLQGEPVVLEVLPQGVPTATTAVQVAAPGAGVAALRATFVANPALPPRSFVALRVTGPDGAVRRYRLSRPVMTVSAGFGGSGLADVRIDWMLVRPGPGGAGAAPVPPGFGVVEPHVVRWTPE